MDLSKKWSCPDCPWVEKAHPKYGWQQHNDRAVEVHKSHLCPAPFKSDTSKCQHTNTSVEPEPGFSGPVGTLIVCYDCNEVLGNVQS